MWQIAMSIERPTATWARFSPDVVRCVGARSPKKVSLRPAVTAASPRTRARHLLPCPVDRRARGSCGRGGAGRRRRDRRPRRAGFELGHLRLESGDLAERRGGAIGVHRAHRRTRDPGQPCRTGTHGDGHRVGRRIVVVPAHRSYQALATVSPIRSRTSLWTSRDPRPLRSRSAPDRQRRALADSRRRAGRGRRRRSGPRSGSTVRSATQSPDGTVAVITVPSARRVPAGLGGAPWRRGPWSARA